MSQHINPTPKQTDVDSVNSKIGDVGSTDLQSQVTALNSKFTWTFLGSVIGDSVSVYIPSGLDYNELCIVVRIDNGGNKQVIQLPKAENTENSWYRSGGYTTIGTPVLVTVFVNTQRVTLVTASLATTDYTSTSSVYVYYR